MNIKATYFFLITFLSLAACTPKVTEVVEKPSKNSPAEVKTAPLPFQPVKTYVVTSIKTTPCYGKCPVYEAKLYSNGKAVWIGKKFTKREGKFETSVSKDEIQEIREEAKLRGIFFMEDSYPAQRKLFITDLPNTIISISNGATPKVITNNHKAPKNLIAFEDYLKDFFENLDWGDKG